MATSHKLIARMVPPTSSPRRSLIKPKCCKWKRRCSRARPFNWWFKPNVMSRSPVCLHSLFGKQGTVALGVGVSIEEENHLNNSKLHSLSARRYSLFLCLCCIFCFPPCSHTSQISKYFFFFFLQIMKCRIRKKKKLFWRGKKKKWDSMPDPACFSSFCRRGVCAFWTDSEQTSNMTDELFWLWSQIYSHNCLQTTRSTIQQRETWKAILRLCSCKQLLDPFFFFPFFSPCVVCFRFTRLSHGFLLNSLSASSEDTYHRFCARYFMCSNKVDGSTLHLHAVGKVSKSPLWKPFANGWKCSLPSLAYLPTLSTLFQTLHHTHTHTHRVLIERLQQWWPCYRLQQLPVHCVLWISSVTLPAAAAAATCAHTLANMPQMASQFQPASPNSA